MNINLYNSDVGTAPSPASPVAARSEFDANLISELKGDHVRLIATFKRLQSIAKSQPSMVVADLILLRELFRDHLETEEKNFYTYLDCLFENHETVRAEARAVWEDMNEIADAVSQFITDWISNPPALHTLPAFLSQLNRTMNVLMARVELEERTLYTLYTRTL
jgi:Hemerythrin HHE cation binding domain